MRTLDSKTAIVPGVAVEMNSGMKLSVHPSSVYRVECVGADGHLKWIEEFNNIVVTAGLDKLLDATIKTGLASPAWYVGLKNTGTIIAADTMGSHSGWTTNTTYSNANDPAFTPGTIASGSVDNSASKAVFNMNGSTTIFGCYLHDNNTKGGTTGILYGGGDFTGSRAVIDGDTLNVQLTLSIS